MSHFSQDAPIEDVHSDLRTGLAEAVAALALSRRRAAPAGGDDLTSLEGPLERQPAERLAPFARQLIVPLVEHDARHGRQLVPTLRALLEHEGVNATPGRSTCTPTRCVTGWAASPSSPVATRWTSATGWP